MIPYIKHHKVIKMSQKMKKHQSQQRLHATEDPGGWHHLPRQPPPCVVRAEAELQ